MEKQNKVAQIYGYAVCLVTVVTFLVSLSSLVDAVFSLSAPLTGGARYGPVERFHGPVDLSSYEGYRMSVLRSPKGPDAADPGYVPDDETLRKMYEATRANRVETVRFHALRDLTTRGLLIIACVVLFATHWIWMRRLAGREA